MIYADDQWLQIPTRDLYDTQIMAMAVNAARDMYEKGLQEYKDFRKEYGDFLSPIAKDMEWYNQNVTGKVRDTINRLYAAGIDPLRSAEGRAAISNIINNIDTGSIGLIRQSAENAKLFLKERSRLEAAGLYNPLYAQYDGPDLNTYSTLGENGQGVWNKMSPTPIQNIAAFGNPYFEGMKPNVHSASKDGVSYSIESITADDLKRIADSRFNELVNTPQGQLMYKYYRDITGDDAAAREAFNNAIAAGQERRIYQKDDYNDNYYKQQTLIHQRNQDKLARDEFNLKMQKYGGELQEKLRNIDEKDLDGMSLYERWYAKGAANVLSTNGSKYNWYDMPNSYGHFGNSAYKVFYDYGQKYVNTPIKREDLLDNTIKEDFVNYLQNIGKGEGQINNILKVFTDRKYKPTQLYKKEAELLFNKYNATRSKRSQKDAILGFEQQFSIPMFEESVVKAIGSPVSGNSRVAKASVADIDRLYSVDDIISNTAGYTKTHTTKNTDQIRNLLRNSNMDKDVTITPLGVGYASLRKNTGSFDVMPKVRVTVDMGKDQDPISFDAYYDIGLGSDNNAGGAYTSNNPILYKNVSDLWSPSQALNPILLSTPKVESVGKTYNLYPSYDRWMNYGLGDTKATRSLTGTSTGVKPTTL